jgi:YesN/AraC family two-component response regulator
MNIPELLKKLTLLIVEDDDIARESLISILKNTFENIHGAQDGQEGLLKTEEINPDIIITDLEMPIMNGMDMIDKIREKHPKKPIIVVTAFADQSHKTDKANRILIKPIIVKELKAALADLAVESAL